MPVYPLTPDATGRHVVHNVMPGTYQFRVTGLPDGWVLDSAIFDGKDTADLNVVIDGSRHVSGVEVKLTSRRAEVGGPLTNASGAPGQRLQRDPVSVGTPAVGAAVAANPDRAARP